MKRDEDAAAEAFNLVVGQDLEFYTNPTLARYQVRLLRPCEFSAYQWYGHFFSLTKKKSRIF